MSKSKIAKQSSAPVNRRRLVEDVEKKGDLKGEGVLRTISAAIKYGAAITAGTANELETEAFWRHLYLVYTEVESYHRTLAKSVAEDLAGEQTHPTLRWMNTKLQAIVVAHDVLRAEVTDADLVRVDLRRHAACHVSVSGNQISLAPGGIVDRRGFTILGGRVLTVEQQDALLGESGDDAAVLAPLAARCLPFLRALIVAATPLHTPRKWAHDKVHVVQEDEGTWADIAKAAGVRLEALVSLNSGDEGVPLQPDATPTPGNVILIPEDA